jgi:DNA adenine methylase
MTNNVFEPPAIVRPAEDLAALLATAKAEHAEGMRAERASLEHYRKAGLALAKAKEAAGHGNWLAALKQTGISQQRASEYMRLAARWHKLPPGGDFALKEALRLASDEPEPLPPRVPAEPSQRIEHEPLAMPNAAAPVEGDPDREAGPEDGGVDECPREEDDPPAEQDRSPGVWRDRSGNPLVLKVQPARLESSLKYHGGKSYLAPAILALMPPSHGHYVEAYAGSLAVLLAKDPNGISEVVNDLNGDLTNFWRVLQQPKSFEHFRRTVEAMPFSEHEWCDARDNLKRLRDADPVQRAVWFFVYCRQSYAGRMDDFTPLTRNRTRRGMNAEASAWITAVAGLAAVHARLRRVVIRNRTGVEVIRAEDGPETLHYDDPPYYHPTRTAKAVYGASR